MFISVFLRLSQQNLPSQHQAKVYLTSLHLDLYWDIIFWQQVFVNKNVLVWKCRDDLVGCNTPNSWLGLLSSNLPVTLSFISPADKLLNVRSFLKDGTPWVAEMSTSLFLTAKQQRHPSWAQWYSPSPKQGFYSSWCCFSRVAYVTLKWMHFESQRGNFNR